MLYSKQTSKKHKKPTHKKNYFGGKTPESFQTQIHINSKKSLKIAINITNA